MIFIRNRFNLFLQMNRQPNRIYMIRFHVLQREIIERVIYRQAFF
jgi:hypothetical protein